MNGVYSLMTDSFELTLNARIDDVERVKLIPINTDLEIHVRSNDFSGIAQWDTDAAELARFSRELVELYSLLAGKARLEQYSKKQTEQFSGLARKAGLTWCEAFIEFEALKGGHFAVRGCLNDDDQSLRFYNCFDQTYLGHFAKSLYDGFFCFADKKYTRKRLY